ncbi:hypothetical protein [Salinibacterium sp. M195]|uniref:hypothetical protein n=1 Tax=Salinibacterium sp. M195 TaxID=2583374 RepID=UPI001C62B843|nr:hypothetical protein [Salinibacterium sp. M195]QYH36948.1 hypothetical protein FFT87_13970 [Salinibacterium sp. M195]
MKPTMRLRLPFILTGVLVLLAVAAIGVFLALDNTVQTTEPTPASTAFGGSEIPQPTETPTTKQLGIETSPLITAPLPDSARADGELVAGFPTSVISLPPSSEVVSSAITIEGDRMQATVVATTDTSEDMVQSYFADAFTALGLQGSDTPAASGTTATTWSNGTDSIIVATTAEGEVTRFSIFALFTAGTS